jgi:hypothetical protein
MQVACILQSLVRRGLYTTALENAKLLLTFNLADPAGVLTCIDYIAIKAGNYPFIQVPICSLFHDGVQKYSFG